ncbi:uncharacterized protein LOC134656122 [Cydia amplana]|uniref:uncharacterized protein LOC134656122 n=1 Tax=Cydia amplana TaxID=1869771 RepID=UPI002FE6645B
MCSLSITLTCFLLIARSCGQSIDGAIGFPEKEENNQIKNKENREPVFLPSMCPVDQLYYPGDQKDDWICDCRPAYLYHPATDRCWPAYRRGPCKEKEYLMLPSNTYIPACVPNPCLVDSYVPWNRKCQQIGLTTPCAHLYPNSAALGVNATTLHIDCVKLNIESRFLEPTGQLPMVVVPCPPGCKRSINGKCTNN